MARSRSHKDVEFEVTKGHGGSERRVLTTHSFAEAAEVALSEAMHSGESNLDVLIWSKAGARHYGGDDAVDEYNVDPEASVFERFEVRVNMAGRIP